ncbi:MAG: response regulator [Rhodanobacter sp.]|jgi:CheY-like chemotaxis protein|nr:response regulator [Rhodanobacter sp.]
MNIDTPHTSTVPIEAPHVLVVDSSRVVRQIIERMLKAELPDVVVTGCGSGTGALAHMKSGHADLITTALHLPDMDGVEFAHLVRETSAQARDVPIIVVSGDVQERLVARTLSNYVTDYFDKSLGMNALAAFIHGYVCPIDSIGGDVLYVEDSRVVAFATTRMLRHAGFSVTHVVSVEDALEQLKAMVAANKVPGFDLVLTDVSLKGDLGGGDLLDCIRHQFSYSKSDLPVLIMTGDNNPIRQAALLREGANDLVYKPVKNRLLIAKLQFQVRVVRQRRVQAAA